MPDATCLHRLRVLLITFCLTKKNFVMFVKKSNCFDNFWLFNLASNNKNTTLKEINEPPY